jgi:hypothetical protein
MVRRLVRSLLLRPVASYNTEVMMNEDVFNTSIRKFLKRLGVTAQREIEKVVRRAWRRVNSRATRGSQQRLHRDHPHARRRHSRNVRHRHRGEQLGAPSAAVVIIPSLGFFVRFRNYRIAHTAWRRSASNTSNLGE